MDKTEHRYRAPALDKGLDILELLATHPGGLTRSEIMKEMGKSPSEIYRMLERLVARNYVSRSLEGDRYALTMKLFHLAASYPPLRRLVMNAQPLMDEFAKASMQSVHLVVPDMGHAHVVAQASSRSAWEFRLRVGAMLDLLHTSSGQTLLAFQDDDNATEILRMAPEGAGGIPAEMAKDFVAIRKNGYRLSASQQLVGVTDISVPVRSANGVTVAVLPCPYLPHVETPTEGAPTMGVQAALNLLLKAAERISKI
ncbi:IclR family transcriptional regulator [Pseudorhodobacter sp.]|uniref:IclR family transcriptional regulator n=1 Tax=Pseudorhodobacter sp. TaxID=1934400 RepID=UPI0026476625|nr:IclR family transcriptional regulator [Pseudorhodobacter sp.]MDN5786178.1 IclR family transcriptional regulator [Pseudorhodobacter sp.]